MENMPTKELVETRNNNKGVMEEHIKEMNFQQDLPSLNELHDYLSYLYDARKWGDFILNYLMLELHVRNKDLNFIKL